MTMPDKRTIEKARADKRAGKSPSTQAGEFVRAEIEKIRRGEHGARSPQQAIAIGLSEARRAGVPLRPPRKGKAKARTRRSAAYAYARAKAGARRIAGRACRAPCRGRSSASHAARRHVAPSRSRRNEPRHTAVLPPARPQLARHRGPRDQRAARRPLAKRRGRGHAAGANGPRLKEK